MKNEQILKIIYIVAVFLSACAQIGGNGLNRSQVKVLSYYNTESLKMVLSKESSASRQVDIVLINSDQVEISWESLQSEVVEANKTLSEYGVSLNVIEALKVSFPKEWNAMEIKRDRKKPTKDYDYYEKMSVVQSFIPQSSESKLKSIIEKSRLRNSEKFHDKVLYVVGISDLIISWYEKDSNNKWKLITSKTSAISFPPYMYEDRIDKDLIGLISLQKVGGVHKTLAHEIGHKLINVSHEGDHVCPKGDGKNIPGLMGYTKSKKIYSGKQGRWHQERLLMSPFLYTIKKGKKSFNPDYKDSGSYDDPLYRDYVILPACKD